MNYWLVCVPRADLDHCIKVRTFGLERKIVIGNVKKGDKIVCCAGKGDWKIIAIGKADSDYYIDDEKVFLKPGIFPDRFKFSVQRLPAEVDMMPLIDRLSFVSNLAFWAVHFRTGMAKLTEEDWAMIQHAAGI